MNGFHCNTVYFVYFNVQSISSNKHFIICDYIFICIIAMKIFDHQVCDSSILSQISNLIINKVMLTYHDRFQLGRNCTSWEPITYRLLHIVFRTSHYTLNRSKSYFHYLIFIDLLWIICIFPRFGDYNRSSIMH